MKTQMNKTDKLTNTNRTKNKHKFLHSFYTRTVEQTAKTYFAPISSKTYQFFQSQNFLRQEIKSLNTKTKLKEKSP